jgi:hypothetical protein
MLLVGELRSTLYEETRPADEFPRLLGKHSRRTLTAVLGVRCLLLVFFLIGDDQPLFEDHVEAGFNVVVIELIVVVLVRVARCGLRFDHHSHRTHDVYSHDVVIEVFYQGYLAQVVIVIVIVYIDVIVEQVGIGQVFEFVNVRCFLEIRRVLGFLAHQRP